MDNRVDQLSFCWADSSDIPQFKEFIVEHFGADSIQAWPGRVEWLYEQNPSSIQVSICRDNGKIVAACGHVPMLVKVADTEVVAGFGVDFMVSAEYRRMNIGCRFLEMRLKRFDISLSTGQSKAMNQLYQKCGAYDLGAYKLGFFYRKPPFFVVPKELAKGWAAWGNKVIHTRSNPLRVIQCGQTDAVSAVSQIANDGHNSAIRSSGCGNIANWFKWRYCSDVYDDYLTKVVLRGTEVVGVVAYRIDCGVQIIVDVITARKNRAWVLSSVASQNQFNETRLFFTGDAMHSDLVKSGFLVRSQEARLIGMIGARSTISSIEPGSIDLMAGAADVDLIRKIDPGKTPGNQLASFG